MFLFQLFQEMVQFFFNLQKTLIDAAKASGIKLFVPSEFGIDFTPIPRNGVFEYKQALNDYLQTSGVPSALIRIGLFYEFAFSPYYEFDTTNGVVTISGDGNTKNHYTHTTDIARIVLQTLKEGKIGPVYASSATLTENEVVALYEKATGKKLKVVSKSAEELLKQANDAKDFFPGKFSPFLRVAILQHKAQHFTSNLNFGTPYSLEQFFKGN